MNGILKTLHTFLVAFLIICYFTSCTPTKNIAYFQDLADTSKIYAQAINLSYDIKVQPDDILEILVNSINAEAAAPFNLGNSNSSSSTIQSSNSVKFNASTVGSQTSNGYLVDKNGFIDFPVFGSLKVAGLSIPQLKDTLKARLNQYLQNPIVNVRLLNYKITVLGAVAQPATYSIPSQRITLIDAIGMAGDLNVFGRRDNVLLIREEDGQRKFTRFDLDSSKTFTSADYYLKQNDIIYVEPNKVFVKNSDATSIRRLTVTVSILSLLISVISIISR